MKIQHTIALAVAVRLSLGVIPATRGLAAQAQRTFYVAADNQVDDNRPRWLQSHDETWSIDIVDVKHADGRKHGCWASYTGSDNKFHARWCVGRGTSPL